MEETILSTIKDYITSKETDYALMINGEWGSGKTHFTLNEIKSTIEKIDCPKSKDNNSNKFKQIYVSLYGISSIEEIKDAIFYAINPSLKWLELLESVAKRFNAPIFGKIFNEPLSKKERNAIRNKINNFEDKVIFFDDLERIDRKKIDMQSVLGYINFLSEHNHHKIIVVANDGIFDNDYKSFKEKTIRFSYNLQPNLSKVFDNIYIKYTPKYEDFLKNNRDFILNIINAGNCKNIRTIIFIIDVFQKIFQKVEGKYEEEIAKDLFLPFAIISIEAKNGYTKKILQDSLPYIKTFSSLLNQGKIRFDLNPSENDNNITNDDKNNYETLLKTKYEQFNNNLEFYPQLYDLVFDGYIPDDTVNQMVEEIRNQYQQLEESEDVKLVKQITHWHQIPDESFEDIVIRVKESIINNKFRVYDILKIYASFIQIESLNIGNLKITDEDTQNFKIAIDNAMANIPFDPIFEWNNPIWSDYDKSEEKEKFEYLNNYAIEKNKKLKLIYDSNKKEELFKIIKNNNVEDFKNFMSYYSNIPLFMSIEAKEIIEVIKDASLDIKMSFFFGLENTFFTEQLQNPSNESVEYLEKLENELKKHLDSQKIKKVSSAYLIYTDRYIQKVIHKYKAILNK